MEESRTAVKESLNVLEDINDVNLKTYKKSGDNIATEKVTKKLQTR